MNRDEKAAVIEEVADQIRSAEAIFAVDYRGLSVKEAADLRTSLVEAGATFRVVKNRLTIRAADAAGAESLKELLEGPTAFTFIAAGGDAAMAAKALARFRRETDALAFKGGQMGGDVLTIEQIESISRLPARDVLAGQFVGVLASPLTTLVRGLAGMISGLASQLQQMADQGLVTGEAPAAEQAPAEEEAEAPAEAEAEAPAEAEAEAPAEAEAEAPAEEAPAAEAEAPAEEPAAEEGEQGEDATPAPQGDPVAEAAEETSNEESETPSEGEETE
jgi:large subunit ribosomal protein L10